MGEERALDVIKFTPSDSQMICYKNSQAYVNSHDKFSRDFGSQLSIENGLLLKCFQLKEFRRPVHLPPPNRAL